MERTMLAKSTIALATAAVLGVVSVAQAATKDKGSKASLGRGPIMQVLQERFGSPRLFRNEPQAPTPVIPNDLEGYPHPK
jgi:hypothetical protein